MSTYAICEYMRVSIHGVHLTLNIESPNHPIWKVIVIVPLNTVILGFHIRCPSKSVFWDDLGSHCVVLAIGHQFSYADIHQQTLLVFETHVHKYILYYINGINKSIG